MKFPAIRRVAHKLRGLIRLDVALFYTKYFTGYRYVRVFSAEEIPMIKGMPGSGQIF